MIDKNNKELVSSVWSFTQLTQSLINTNDNMVYSPFSLYLALSLLLPASFGESYTELLNGLSLKSKEAFEINSQVLLAEFQTLDEQYASLLTNSIWLQDHELSYDKDILKDLQIKYQASTHYVDFTQTIATQEKMSAFINQQTNGFISDLDISFGSDTLLVLLNTLYFKAHWQVGFYSEDSPLNFLTYSGKSVSINTVYATVENPVYYRDDNVEILALPLENKNKMLFIKPKDLKKFFKKVKLVELKDKLKNLTNTKVRLHMPEVDISSHHIQLNQYLSSLGFQNVMSSHPQLSFNSNRADNMMINDIVQQVRLAVDRSGVEAAAYTAIGIRMLSDTTSKNLIDMSLNRPYLMLLLSADDLPLFMATVMNPID